jgi:Arc/MetJ family transcription regulator
MRTNIDLDDKLVEEAFKYSKYSTKKELVNEALEEYITNHNKKNILDLMGKIQFEEDYDYKALRESIKR